MSIINYPTEGLYGLYHDVLRDASGNVSWDGGVRRNTIVTDCRRLLAGFMRRGPASAGITGLFVGAGSPTWDPPGTTPAPTANQTALVDSSPFNFPLTSAQITFLDPATGAPSGTTTNRIQIVATLGSGSPPSPWPGHSNLTLREFGLFGQLGGANVLINYVTHPAIVKDPTSTLERTIWLIF